jgi:hypothetical protein
VLSAIGSGADENNYENDALKLFVQYPTTLLYNTIGNFVGILDFTDAYMVLSG